MNMSRHLVRQGLAGLVSLLATCVGCNAWGQQAAGQTPEIYDRAWGAMDLYDSPDSAVVQSFSLIGRYHGQFWSVHGDEDDAQDWENRRRIVGFSSRWFGNFTLQAQMFIDTGEAFFYDGLYEAFVQWSPEGKDFSLSAGRLDFLFTGYERSTSSKRITTIERGQLVNQLMPGEVIGAHLRDKTNRFSYHAGLFSRGIKEEFDDFDSGAAAVAGAAIDASLWMEEGTLQLEYLHNSRGDGGNAFEPYRHIVSLWHKGERGRLGMATDITFADALGQAGNVLGLTLLPTWRLLDAVSGNNDPLQLALRYQYTRSSADNGLMLQRRYEGEVAEGRGDRYQALYLGLNYYLYDHKLKFMLAGEYARMEDAANDGGGFRGWTWFSAVRLYF
jgi:hypothetical protein